MDVYIYEYSKIFVKDSLSKSKKCRFYLFRFFDYQINFYMKYK